MKSHTVQRMATSTIAVTAVLAVFGVSAPALADPDPLPDDASEELREYRELTEEAEQLNEEYLRAQDDLAEAEDELEQATQDLDDAEQAEEEALEEEREFRQVVDQFAGASYTGETEFSEVSALLTGDSAQDFLERSSALDVLAADQNEAMAQLSSAVDRASAAQRDAADAQTRAGQARDAAAELTADIEERQETLDERIAEVERAADSLTDDDRDMHQTEGAEAPTDIVAPGSAAQQAVDAAMSKQGSPYEWGAQGPDRFDCSGLTAWAYEQAGQSIPRSSSAQAEHGQPVPRDQLEPGDLVFFYDPVSHVGIYVGDGKIVHAPQQGDVVKVESMMDGEFNGARRVS